MVDQNLTATIRPFLSEFHADVSLKLAATRAESPRNRWFSFKSFVSGTANSYIDGFLKAFFAFRNAHLSALIEHPTKRVYLYLLTSITSFLAFTSLSSTVFWIVGMILLTNIPRAHRLGPVKHLINCWCVFVFVVSTSFSSNLYSYITSPAYSDIILEIGDMLKANYHWGLMYPPSFVTMLNMQVNVSVFSFRNGKNRLRFNLQQMALLEFE